MTRLVGQYAENGTIRARQSRGRRFTPHYGPAAIALLAEVDEAHETLSGPATKKLLNRGWHEYADARYENMAEIWSSHIYNLRKRREYREQRMVCEKTRPTPVTICERRQPESRGKPGYIRVDSVQQGGLDEKRGGGTTSMPSTRSRNSRSSPPWNIFPRRGSAAAGGHDGAVPVPDPSVSIPITAANASTGL